MLALRNDTTESPGNPLMVLKFWLIVSGIYIWEFVTTLDFEWSVIRGHQRYRWSIWIYTISRISGLVVVSLALFNFSATSEFNCQAWVTIGWAFSALGGYGLSSLLIMLRIFAIWDRNKIVLAISAIIWLINLGFQLAGIIKIRSVWVPAQSACVIANIESCKDYYVNLLANDAILLLIMLAGLMRLRLRARAFHDLTSILWKQGVIWLVVATAAELPQVLLLLLNLNESLNFLFLLPAMVTTIIAATRTYRSLVIYASTPSTTNHPTGPDSSNFPRSNRLVSGAKPEVTSTIHIPSNRRLEVAVHNEYEEYPMSRINRYPSSDGQLADKTLHDSEAGSDDNVEGREEKK
ncbi:hypothetical protein V8E52_008522 [Russula decolorans]